MQPSVAVQWVVVVVFLATSIVTLAALVGWVRVEPKTKKLLVTKNLLEITAAALFLFHGAVKPAAARPAYVGTWSVRIQWYDSWIPTVLGDAFVAGSVTTADAEGGIDVATDARGVPYGRSPGLKYVVNGVEFANGSAVADLFVVNDDRVVQFNLSAYPINQKCRRLPTYVYTVELEPSQTVGTVYAWQRSEKIEAGRIQVTRPFL